MADYNFSVFDYLQVDLPDQDYTYAQVESHRENDALNILFKFTDQADMYGLVIQDFDLSAGSSFGYIPTIFSILAGLSRSDILAPKIDETMSTLASLFRNDTIAPVIADLTDIVALFSATDELLISGAMDQLNTILVFLSRADAINPRIDEFFSILVSLARSDTLAPRIDETLTLLAQLAVFDEFPITLDEFFSILSFVVGHFRFRNDDGTEATATWLQNEDTNASRSINVNTRLRIQVDTGGDTGSTQLALQWRKVSDPDWEWRDVQ